MAYENKNQVANVDSTATNNDDDNSVKYIQYNDDYNIAYKIYYFKSYPIKVGKRMFFVSKEPYLANH